MPAIRPYAPADADSWVRCRALSFLTSAYFDDVRTTRDLDPDLAVALVAVDGDDVVGLIDLTRDGDVATIDTIAVHPDAHRRGIATDLLDAAVADLPADVTTIDAWTRDDVAANGWYAARGFAEATRYLHVYKGWDEPAAGFTTPDGLSAPVTAFCHAPIEREAEVRARFARVHVCRQYVRARAVPATPAAR